MIIKSVEWSQLKSFIQARSVPLQYVEYDTAYELFGIDGHLAVTCRLVKEPSDTTDLDDFNTNFKPNANDILEPIDYDNAPQVRMKMAKLGAKYLGDCFEVTTAKVGSKIHLDYTGADPGYVTAKFYDANGAEVTDEANNATIVKTVVDWEPPFDYEVIGGAAWCEDKPTTDVRCWAVAAPDIPAQYGGSIEFLRNLNFEHLQSQEFYHDGRVAKQMHYNSQTHQGKFRFIFRHNAGVQLDVMIEMEIFR